MTQKPIQVLSIVFLIPILCGASTEKVGIVCSVRENLGSSYKKDQGYATSKVRTFRLSQGSPPIEVHGALIKDFSIRLAASKTSVVGGKSSPSAAITLTDDQNQTESSSIGTFGTTAATLAGAPNEAIGMVARANKDSIAVTCSPHE
jgi:hypothetical protein